MTLTRNTAVGTFAALCLVLFTMPSRASAQAGGGRGGLGGAQDMQQLIKQLDLTPDQETKIQDILKQVQQDVREQLQGLQDATPDERREKMQGVQKMISDAKAKVEDELTPEQKAKYFPLSAKQALKREVDLVTALKSSATKMDIPDDQHKQLSDIFDDSAKTLDGYKADADAVTDSDGSTAFTKKITQFQLDLRKQVVDVLGQDDAQKLMQSARQSMAGGFGGQRQRKSAGPTTTPSTAPTAN